MNDSGSDKSPRRTRRVLILAGAGGVVLLLGIWSAFGLSAVLNARTEALAGLDKLEGIQATTDPEVLRDVQARQDTTSALRAAGVHFAAAQDHLESFSVIPLRALPVAGTQLRSVDALATSAHDGTTILADLLEELGPMLDIGQLGISQITTLLPKAHRALDDAATGLESLDLGPSTGLIETLADARSRFEQEIRRPTELLRDAATITGGLDSFFNQPKTYVVAAANNAEMRAGSGMWLMVGSIDTNPGGVQLGEFDHSSQMLVPPGEAQILDEDYNELWGWMLPQIDWRNLAASPRFPASAVTAADMWFGLNEERADGVIVLDILAMQALLEAIGPISVGDDTLTSDNVVEFLSYEQYAIRNPDRRRERLTSILGATFAALLLRPIDPFDLAQALSSAGESRNILIWSRFDQEQQAWETLGVDGSLPDEALALSVVNRGVNKLDQFLDVDAEIVATESGSQLSVEITARVANSTPEEIHSYVAGGSSFGAPPRHYHGVLTFNVPGYAQGISTDSAADIIVEGPDGPTQVVGLWIEVPPGAAVEHTISFVVPTGQPMLTLIPSARLPATEWSSVLQQFTDATGRVIDLAELAGA